MIEYNIKDNGKIKNSENFVIKIFFILFCIKLLQNLLQNYI